MKDEMFEQQDIPESSQSPNFDAVTSCSSQIQFPLTSPCPLFPSGMETDKLFNKESLQDVVKALSSSTQPPPWPSNYN